MMTFRRIGAASVAAASLFAILIGAIVAPAAHAATAPKVAPPASARAIAACGERAAEQRQTAHVEREVRGIGSLGGCVTDASGIEHVMLDWASADGRMSGRICADPVVRGSAWSCTWDTRELTPGAYVVTMTAVDAAGNRGSSDQAYRVLADVADDVEQDSPTPPAADGDAQADAEAPAPELAPTPERDANAEPETAPEPETDSEPVPAPEPLEITPPLLSPPLQQLVDEQLVECARLELAPGVVADRSLSLAVLQCMEPAFDALDAAKVDLDEVPIPPSIRVVFTDAAGFERADELLPDAIGGVALELELDVDFDPEAPAESDESSDLDESTSDSPAADTTPAPAAPAVPAS